MPPTGTVPVLIRFGQYEADIRAGVLSRNGNRAKIQDQPFRVLAILLQSPGEVVTREEFKLKLGLSDTFIDFDNSLNTDINKIREALGDVATKPRFIETIPRRGYRFIAPVEACDPDTHTQCEEESTVPPLPAMPPVEESGRKKYRTSVVVVPVAALTVVAALAVWFAWPVEAPTVLSIQRISNDHRDKSGGPMLVHSDRLYMSEMIGDHFKVVEMSASGGEPRVIPSPLADTWALDVAPDGSSLLVVNATQGEPPQLWILPLPSGPPLRVGNLLVRAAAWSPDGRHIAYLVDGKPELYMAKPDGTEAFKIATLPQPGSSPCMAFSPDGAWVHTDTGREIWEAPTQGGSAAPLISTGGKIDTCGRYTPDGRYFVYQQMDPRRELNIWIAPSPHQPWWRRRLRHPVRLTSGPLFYVDPVPSRDGNHLFVLGSQFRSELLRYDSHLQQFMPLLPDLSAGLVAPSPDGKWIAYVSYPEGVLWRSRPDGSDRLQLSSPGYTAFDPAWSPDSKRIAFDRAGQPSQIMIVSVDGGMPEPLVSGTVKPNETVTGPTWSADGSQIAYTDVLDGNVRIKIIDIGSHRSDELPGSRGLGQPSWSPDGRRLLAVTALSDKIMSYNFTSRKWSEFVTGSSLGCLVWSSDAKFLHYEAVISKESVLMRVPAGGGRPQRVVSLSDVARAQWCNAIACPGTWSGLLGNDPVVQRDLNFQEIFRLDLKIP